MLCLALLLTACSGGNAVLNAEQISGGSVLNGQHLVYGYGCGTCHIIPGIAEASGAVGPSLQGFASRVYIAGSMTNEPEHLVQWITDPQKIVPGNAMPNLGVTRDQARQIAAFLYTLR
jgi:cytochrome c2